jgi:ankyrin repeat protein
LRRRVISREDGGRMTPGEFLEKILCNDVAAVTAAIAADRPLIAARDPHLGSTPLHFAAHRGFTEIVVALLDAGADIHARETVSDTTPLHWAAEAGFRDVARILLDHGADLEARDEWFRLSPLGWATVVSWAPDRHRDRPHTAADLLARGARHDLFTAVATGQADVVRSLVAADPYAVYRRLGFVGDNQTALHVAVRLRRPDMVRLLVDHGADVHATTADGQTPLALAGDQPAIVELLHARGARDDASACLAASDLAGLADRLNNNSTPPSRLLFHAARHGQADALPLLLQSGADPHTRTRRLVGEIPAAISPLHIAAQHGHTAVVAALLDAGADIRGGADPGVPTPLHVAAGNGYLDAVELLLARGADVHDREQHHGSTPLGWAEWAKNAEIIALLRARSTD